MGRAKHLSYFSALVFALSFPLHVLRLNQQLTAAMHMPREGEQGLLAPQALRRWGSMLAQQDLEKGDSSSAVHFPWQETAKRCIPLPSFRKQGSCQTADSSKATSSRSSQGRHDEEKLCSKAKGAPWQAYCPEAGVCIDGVLRCHSKRKNKPPRVGIS